MPDRGVAMKRVAFYLGWPGGGVETFVANLTERLPTLGWKPYVLVNMAVCPDWSGYYRRRGVAVRELPFRSFGDPRGKDYILKALHEINVDVYVPNYQEIPHRVVTELPGTGKASVLIANASYPEYLAEITPFARYAQRFVGVSQTISCLLREMSEVPADRVRYIPYGVRLARSFPTRHVYLEKPLRIIYTGRMTNENKRAWRYLELAHQLIKRGVNFEMTLLGDGPKRLDMLKAIHSSSVLRNRVQMPGVVLPGQVPRFLLEHDVFVLLSDTEGMPLSLLEAMGYGLIPVASNIASGVAEVVSPAENGYLVPTGNVEAAAAVVERIAEHPELRLSLALRAYETVKDEFSIGRMARRYVALFEEASWAT